MNYKLFIFDLDGTLADTSAGIYSCHIYANQQMGKPITDKSILDGIIGGPLLESYKVKFGYSDEDAKKAVSIYRKQYETVGIVGATLYNGMAETLAQLKSSGVFLAVATLKAERLAKPMLAHLGIAHFFDVIHGVDDNDICTKADLLKKCIAELGVSADETVLVGDSVHDMKGAEQTGIDFIAALYGFDFHSESVISSNSFRASIKTPMELLTL